MVVGIIVWAFSGILLGHRPIGGGDLQSYAFDLSTCLVPRDELVPSGQPRDFLRPLTVGPTMQAAAMSEFNRTHRKRYVVTDDRIVGVTIGGIARAYPLYILEGHEVIEDTLDGVPIVVTYSPFCDAIAVYDRRIDGVTLSFGVSGLLRNANTLIYDRDTPVPSLWQQLDGRAIAGPAAVRGAALAPIPNVALTTWADWIALHPDSDLPERDEGNVRLYEGISYGRSRRSATLEYPVRSLPPDGSPLKSPMLVVEIDGQRTAFDVQAMRRVAVDGEWRTDVRGTALVFTLPTGDEAVARVRAADDRPITVIPCFWFAAWSTLGIREKQPQL